MVVMNIFNVSTKTTNIRNYPKLKLLTIALKELASLVQELADITIKLSAASLSADSNSLYQYRSGVY
ncbi:unnamed protein product [Rotaria sp. Silwood2]|nr:unnamed protein product [Rotaria sp. Silwood2]